MKEFGTSGYFGGKDVLCDGHCVCFWKMVMLYTNVEWVSRFAAKEMERRGRRG